MIALLVEESLPIEPFRDRLRHVRPTVWGPFHALLGKDRGGEEVVVLRATGRAGFHAAARLAAHRDARLLLGLSLGVSSPEVWDELGRSPAVLPVARVLDLSPLEPLQRRTSDLAPASSLILPANPVVGAISLDATGAGAVCGTLVFPLTIPAIATLIGQSCGANLFDTNLFGLAEAAEETASTAAHGILVTGAIGPSFRQIDPRLVATQIRWRNLLAEFLDRSGWLMVE